MILQAPLAKACANLGLTALMSVSAISVAGEEQADFNVSLDNAWVRAMPPSQFSTAGYLTVHNQGANLVEIVAASSRPLANVEMHNSSMVNGLMSMERVHIQPVAGGETVEFTPGGKHLMIMGLEKMPAPGDSVELCLEFNTGHVVCTDADVRRMAPTIDDGAEHQHH